MGILGQASGDIGIPLWLLVIVITWELVWKGLSMWKSSKKDQPYWFITLLVLNTFGILQILYYYVFSEVKLDERSKKKTYYSKNKKSKKSRTIKRPARSKLPDYQRKTIIKTRKGTISLPITED